MSLIACLPSCYKLVDNLGQAVREQRVGGFLADLLEVVKFLHDCVLELKRSLTQK